MRAFAFALAISAVLVEAAWAAPPARVASLNLCTDELLLALAAPGQISSLTHLSHDRRESAYWRTARGYRANGGSILSVAQDRPDLIVTMGGGGRDSAGLAAALSARLIALPFPTRLQDVRTGIRRLANALGRQQQGAALIAGIDRTVAGTPSRKLPAVFVDRAGLSISPDGAAAQWLETAGLRQIPLAGNRLDRERLLRLPPVALVISDYRADQYGRSSTAPIRRVRDRWIRTDGRRWTCMGPSLIPEIARLRRMAER